MLPALDGLRVLDFTTLLPGPLTTLLMAEAGADVIKVERPGRGDEMRSYTPRFGDASVNFGLLNRGKRSLALDLKSEYGARRARTLASRADVVIEQFRPGVMARLGLGYDELRALNPGLVYCSISGFGQTGPRSGEAAHDLNYQATTGLLSLSGGADGSPVLPAVLAADIVGGAYPAAISILMALRRRDQTGTGTYLDVSMTDNLFTLLYWALGEGLATGRWPGMGEGLIVGGTPRYGVYRTADGRHVALGALEDRFWARFCELVELAPRLRAPAADPKATRAAIAARVAERTAAEWESRFAGEDVCCTLVRTVEEAVADPHFASRGLFDARLENRDRDGAAIAALPTPVPSSLRRQRPRACAPALGELDPGEELWP